MITHFLVLFHSSPSYRQPISQKSIYLCRYCTRDSQFPIQWDCIVLIDPLRIGSRGGPTHNLYGGTTTRIARGYGIGIIGGYCRFHCGGATE
jgi:hypothetical protein